jgi:hypothetical protein
MLIERTRSPLRSSEWRVLLLDVAMEEKVLSAMKRRKGGRGGRGYRKSEGGEEREGEWASPETRRAES